jgi:magnesium chelatase accessory protein
MRWPEDATGWPMRDHSRMVLHRPHRWHIQEAGEGPLILLIHGAGGATQSWRGLFPLLAETHGVVAVDLPGQGFTQLGARDRCGLDPVATDLAALCAAQDLQPDAIVGHSAGVAIALRMAAAQRGRLPVIGINAALANFRGLAGWLFPAMARALALTPFSANIFAATVTTASVERLIAGTGSTIDARGIDLYRRLASDPGHVDATLTMMAQWSLDGLWDHVGAIGGPVTLLAGSRDRTVPPSSSHDATARLANARVIDLPGLGHLAHEEDPVTIAAMIREVLA